MKRGDEEWVVETLREFERRQCISRVLDVRSEAAVAKGDNYSSEMLRLKLDAVLHSGEVETRSVVCKNVPQGSTGKFVRQSRIFIKEKRMFSEVFPAMRKLRRQFSCDEEPFHAQCYGTQGNEKILLEDLTVYGYKVAGDRKGLDFDHCKLVVEALAKFHALGAVLIQNGDISIDDFYQHQFEKERKLATNMLTNNFHEAAWKLENRWKDEWVRYAGPLRKLGDRIGEDVLRSFERDDSRFLTLLHGDCWMNNSMFRYDNDGKPVAVRLLDFQLCWYNRVGYDLEFFFWTSALTEVRPRKPELRRAYHDTLCRCLRLYGYAKEPPTFADVEEDCRSLEMFGFACALTFIPFMLAPRDNVPNMEKVTQEMKDEGGLIFIQRDTEEGEIQKMTMEYIIKEAGEIGVLDMDT